MPDSRRTRTTSRAVGLPILLQKCTLYLFLGTFYLLIFGHVKRAYILISLLLLVILGSCRKEQIFSRQSVNLGFSADTIFLDTVFTQVGSSTRTLRVFNPTDNDIYIDRISLGRGNESYFRLNVNGTPTKKGIEDVELLAKDSLTIRIEVTADVGMSNELLYTDSIVFNTLGNIQDVDLVTLARDAHFIYPTNTLVIEQPYPYSDIRIPYSILEPNANWGTDKPYVVYGYAVVDSGSVLTINPGAEVHFHSGSGLWVTGGGQLQIDPNNLGQVESNPVMLQGDRLEPEYEDIAGQWGGIFGGIFIQYGSTGNVINNAIIKNSTIGVRTDSATAANINLTINNTLLLNHSRVALYGGYSNIVATNTVIGNAGLYGLYALGGNYDFTHCTFGNYSFGRSTPSIGLFNYFEPSAGVRLTRDIESAEFKNCIVWGSRSVEFGLGYESSADLNFIFKNSLLRIAENPDDGSFDKDDQNQFENCLFDNPEFVNYNRFDYSLDSISPAIDAGNSNFAQDVPSDILKNNRTSNPDIGAYERQ